MQRLLWCRGLGAANRAVINGGAAAACCRVEFHSVKRMTSTGATWTGDARGPTVEGRPHVVRFGKVGDENRGANPIDPPLEREDKYFWLRDDTRSKPEVIDHLKRERDFLNYKTAPLASATAKIYDEHVAYLNETDTSCPVRQDGFEYYRRTIKGLSYGIWCRRPRTATPFVDSNVPELGQQAGEEILLDANKLAEGKSHCDIGELDTSPSHGRLAYSVDFTGNEVYELHILDLTAGGSVIETLVGPKFSGEFEWGLDDSTLYYTTRDDALRTFRVYRHVIGTALDADELVFEEKDELFSVGCGKTLEGNHMVIASGSSETSEEFLLDLRAATVPTAPVRPLLRVVRPREFGVRYSVEGINGDAVYISTNIDECINNKIVRATLAAPGDWSNVIVPHDEDVKIDSVSVFRNAIIVGGRSDGLSQIWSLQKDPNGEFSADSSFVRFVPPEPIFDIGLSSNDEFDPATVRISYDSLTTPTEWWELDPSTLQYTSVKQKVVHGYDKTLYKAERLAAEAGDGTKIDISVVYRADLDRTKPQPTLLYGYGSYGICIDPGFSAGILPYIARGVIYCIAHVRGGGENGRAWYEVQGKYLTKRNTFTDFIACAEQLIEDGVTRPDLLATEGRSAGGLLMGAISNMRPDLFNVVLAGVPFVDVMTTMCDPSIPLTTGEWEEWGNPNEWKFHDYMLSYSPMDNVRRQPYPNILIVAGLHDPRVAYWEPAKWAVKLREHSTSTNDVLLKMDLDAGHFSASDRYKYLREKAFEQAYVLSKIAPHTIASA